MISSSFRSVSAVFALCVFASAVFGLSWQEIVDRSSGAVVHLEGLSADGLNRMSGTGFFITSDGVLITNRHIAESVPNGALVAYSIFGQRLGIAKLEADTVGDVDLAVMKVMVTKPVAYLRPHELNSASAGDAIVVLGFPNNQLTISKGSVGGFVDVNGQAIVELRADITHGSSGSPVLDTDGNVLGVVTGSVTGPNSLGQKIEVGYAEPIESAIGMVNAVLHKIHPER